MPARHGIGRIEQALARRPGIGLPALRHVAGGHPVVMTIDNVVSRHPTLKFRDFLAHHGFPVPLACAVLSVAGRFLGGLALVTGLHTRIVGLVVTLNFFVAIAMVDSHAPYPAAFPVLALVAMALCLAFAGPGRLSLDHRPRGVR